jgi:Na+/H+ antiporter NhaD/arsenite permease-like protein
MTGFILIFILVLTLIIQAIIPKRKLLIIITGATVSSLFSLIYGNQDMQGIYNRVPWDVLVILIGLGVYSSIIARSRLFDVLAVWSSRISRGRHLLILLMFSSIMFILSCTLNNITALLLILPVLITILKILGATQSFISICFALIIVACNLGGAATPIGDFPAILLMGTGSISFKSYLLLAFPMCMLTFFILLCFYVGFYFKTGDLRIGKIEASFALATTRKLYRNVSIKYNILVPGLIIFIAMFVLWTFGSYLNLSPDIVCFLGVACYAVVNHRRAENILRTKIDFESIVFLTSLFVMVSCMAGSGILDWVAVQLSTTFANPKLLICMLMLLTGISTAIFSAGPSMATMLPIALKIIAEGNLSGDIVLVGLALSVCAGSSFFLTAATAGPLAQTMIEKSLLTTNNDQVAKFNFMTFLPYGVFSYLIIQLVAISFVFIYLK